MLGGECSIQLSYADMFDFWLKIRVFLLFTIGTGNRLYILTGDFALVRILFGLLCASLHI